MRWNGNINWHGLSIIMIFFFAGSFAHGTGWTGQTAAFRVDARAGGGAAPEAKESEWAVWDAAWTEGAERVEVTLERPDGAAETLGGGEGGASLGSAEWAPGADEWGTFTLRHRSWDAGGALLEELVARIVRRMPPERAYAAWVEARGGTPETLPMEGDADNDGASNWEEYVADTDPWNGEEVFETRLAAGGDGTLRVEPSVVRAGRVYGVRVWRDWNGEAEWRDLGPGREGIGLDWPEEGETIGFGAVGVSVP